MKKFFMKRISNKVAVVLGCIICIIAVILMLIYFNCRNTNILFKYSYSNYAWEPVDTGFVIYSNGLIKEYDEYNKKSKLKYAWLTKNELKQLKELSNLVEDECEKYNGMTRDFGVYTNEIYSERLGEWVVLSQHGDFVITNSTGISKQILQLTDEFRSRYLGYSK